MDIIINDDYASLDTGIFGFYYGYEYGKDEDENDVYGFEVVKNGEKIYRISYEDMKQQKCCPDKLDMEECLLFGIGLYVNIMARKINPYDIDKFLGKDVKVEHLNGNTYVGLFKKEENKEKWYYLEPCYNLGMNNCHFLKDDIVNIKLMEDK